MRLCRFLEEFTGKCLSSRWASRAEAASYRLERNRQEIRQATSKPEFARSRQSQCVVSQETACLHDMIHLGAQHMRNNAIEITTWTVSMGTGQDQAPRVPSSATALAARLSTLAPCSNPAAGLPSCPPTPTPAPAGRPINPGSCVGPALAPVLIPFRRG